MYRLRLGFPSKIRQTFNRKHAFLNAARLSIMRRISLGLVACERPTKPHGRGRLTSEGDQKSTNLDKNNANQYARSHQVERAVGYSCMSRTLGSG